MHTSETRVQNLIEPSQNIGPYIGIQSTPKLDEEPRIGAAERQLTLDVSETENELQKDRFVGLCALDESFVGMHPWLGIDLNPIAPKGLIIGVDDTPGRILSQQGIGHGISEGISAIFAHKY